MTSGTAVVLPKGALPKHPLGGGVITIVQILPQKNPEVRVRYPDGFEKWHPAVSLVDLLGRIGGTLKGRYGVESYNFIEVPKELGEGTITLGDIVYEQR